MRRFRLTLVTEIDFVDGDEPPTRRRKTTRSIFRAPFSAPPRTSRSGPSRPLGSKASRSQKSRMSSNARPARPADAHRLMRKLRPSRRRQRRSPAGDSHRPRSWPATPLQRMLRKVRPDPTRLAHRKPPTRHTGLPPGTAAGVIGPRRPPQPARPLDPIRAQAFAKDCGGHRSIRTTSLKVSQSRGKATQNHPRASRG
jgi:hypothetical protein